MAEQIKVADLTINADDLLKEMQKTKGKIDELAESQKDLRKAGDTSSKQYIEQEQKLKSLRKEYNQQGKTLQAVTGGVNNLQKELDKEINSIKEANDQNSKLRRIRDELNTSTEEGQKALKAINKRIDENTNLRKDNTDAISKQKDNVGGYTKAINASKVGVKGFGLALKAAGIGLAVAAFAKLSEVMQGNKRISKLLNTAMTALSAIISPLFNAVLDGAEAAYQATGGFDAMGRVIGSLITLGLTPLKTAFYGIKDVVLTAQLAWEKSIFGSGDKGRIAELTNDLNNNKRAIREVGQDAVKAGKDIYSSMGEAVGELQQTYSSLSNNVSKAVSDIKGKGISGILGEASDIAEFNQQLEQLDTKQEAITLKYQKQAEILRQKRDDETLTIAQRKQANEELSALLTEQEAKEKEIVNQKIKGYQQILAINKDDLEAQNALAEARNQILEVEERITGQMSEEMMNRNSLRNEEIANTKEHNKKKTEAELAYEKEKNERVKELKNMFREEEKEREALKTEEDIETHYSRLEGEIERLIEEKDIKRELLKNLEIKKNAELEEIKVANREKEKARLQEEVDTYFQAENMKIDAKRKAVDAISGLVDKETAVGKAALIAKKVLAFKEWALEQKKVQAEGKLALKSATMDSAKGLQKTTASAPFPWNIPLIAGYVAQVAGIFGTIKSVLGGGDRPSFGRGGILSGASHAMGGIQTEYGELEGEEAVINKRSTSMFRGVLSKINQAGGGRAFDTAGGSGSLINYDLLAVKVADANRSLPSPRVAVDEINSTNERVQSIESKASF